MRASGCRERAGLRVGPQRRHGGRREGLPAGPQERQGHHGLCLQVGLEHSNYFQILEDMKIKFGSSICPCVVPARLDDGTSVYINLFSQKAFKYESGKQIQVDLPDIGHRFQGLIEA